MTFGMEDALGEEDRPQRPVWLVTLADLSLLLVGFFVFLKASEADPKAMAARIRAGFTAPGAAAMPVDLAVAGFAAGSARFGDLAPLAAWARSATRDPRTRLHITGETDGSGADVDPAMQSGEILASDRARAVAAALIASGAVAADRIRIATGRGQRRAVLTLSYDAGRQVSATRQPDLAAR